MAIRFLTSRDFVVLGNKQKTLGLNSPGNVLVFFKMGNDPNCAEFEPIFSKLVYNEPRVSYAVLDIAQYRDVVMTARQTTTPITAVPVLILYVNGRPHAKFNGTKNIPSIKNFLTKALGAAQPPPQQAAGQRFMPGQNMYTGQGEQAPQGKSFMPDIGSAPSLKGVIKGGGYANGNNVEDDDEPRLMVPDTIIPHNTPWEADYNQ